MIKYKPNDKVLYNNRPYTVINRGFNFKGDMYYELKSEELNYIEPWIPEEYISTLPEQRKLKLKKICSNII